MQLNNARSAETIMIGDTYEADIRGAQNANIDQIYFNSKSDSIHPEKPATYKVKSLQEIVSIL